MNYYDEEIDIHKESSGSSGKQNIPSLNGTTSAIVNKDQSDLLIDSTSTSNETKITTPTELIRQRSDSSESESEISKNDVNKFTSSKLNSDNWNNLKVPQDVKDVFQNIVKYVPQNIDAEYNLYPFIPEYVPAVGDVDAFLKISCPETLNPTKQRSITDHNHKMGLNVLDEPNGYQSDPTTLMMKLRSTSIITTKRNSASNQIPIAKNSKDIDKWINEISEVHNINQSYKISNPLEMIEQLDNSDVDYLMVEWQPKLENVLNRIGLPSPQLNCDLEIYCKILCNLFDIPISSAKESKYIAIHDLFNLYLAIRESYE